MSGPAAQVLNIVEKRLTGLWTLVPAVVDTVNRQKMTCDVRVKVSREVSQYLQIRDVPIAFPRGGDSVILLPIQSNDVVLVGFSKWSLDQLLIDIQIVVKENLDSDRKFHYQDAIIMLGFAVDNEKGQTLMDDVVLEIPEGDIIIYDPDVVKIGAVLKIMDLGGDPPTPEDGMIWRDGTKLYGKSSGVISEWGSGGGGGAWPRYLQATEPTIPANTEALWWDTVNLKMWLIINKSGTNYKVEAS